MKKTNPTVTAALFFAAIAAVTILFWKTVLEWVPIPIILVGVGLFLGIGVYWAWRHQ